MICQLYKDGEIYIMATKENNKTKILVKVHEPLIAIMQHKIDAACLKRDAYLDKALRVEAEFLRKEIATPNSDKAKNYIAAQLGDLKLKPLTLVLSAKTVDLINEVCKEKNVPRDAFMNRFFLLLIASDTILTALFQEFLDEDEKFSSFVQYDWNDLMDFFPNGNGYYQSLLTRNENMLDAIEEMVTKYSPFELVRGFLKYLNEKIDCKTMYSFPFKKASLKSLPSGYESFEISNALGFNPFMSDLDIEEHKTIEEWSLPLNDKLLDIMEKEKQAKKEKQQAHFEKLEKHRAKIEGEQK